jgi:dihydroflavonol-4-reductase
MPATESTPPHPISDYGASKLASQRIAQSFGTELPVTVVVPPAVYGPGDKDFLVYFKLIARGIMPVIGSKPRYLSLIYARELAEVIAALLRDTHAPGGTYLADDGCVRTWDSIGAAIGNAMNRTARTVRLPSTLARCLGAVGDAGAKLTNRACLLNSQKIRELLQEAWTCSSQRLMEDFGYSPQYPLERGLAETLAWYRKERWLAG